MEVALDRLVGAALAATVFAFASGSTIEYRVLLDARPARWYCLGALVAVSALYAVRAGRRSVPLALVGLGAALVALALASTLWSVDPTLTAKRAASFAALIAAAAFILYAAAGRPDRIRRLLAGLLIGAVAVAVAGLVVLAVDHDAAVQPATTEYPARYRGYEQNPNTAAMLLAVATPLACLFTWDARSRLIRPAAVVALLLFAGSLAASGARGPMLAAFLGVAAFALVAPGSLRRRLAVAAVAAAVFAACLGISRIPDPKPLPRSSTGQMHVPPTRRTLLTSSGRFDAWRDAIRQAEDRPVAGYGFGTEADVFVNRSARFVSDLPENSYIGAALQLGLVGVALLLAAFAWALLRALALVRSRSGNSVVAAAAGGAVVAAAAVAVTQSYLFSVGNLATATAWVCLFLLVGAAEVSPRQRAASASSASIASSETRTSHSG